MIGQEQHPLVPIPPEFHGHLIRHWLTWAEDSSRAEVEQAAKSLVAELNASEEPREVLREILAAGLRLRTAKRLGWDAVGDTAYRLLEPFGPVEGLSVCESCQMVFEPKRRKHRVKCDACHSTPRPEAKVTSTEITYPVPMIDLESGEQRGWRRRTLKKCLATPDRWEPSVICGTWFEAKNGKQDACSNTCGKRISRWGKGAAPDLGAGVDDDYLASVRAVTSLQSEQMIDQFRGLPDDTRREIVSAAQIEARPGR